jgi:hypothetical protein
MRAGLDPQTELKLHKLLQTRPLSLGMLAQLLALLRVAHKRVRVGEKQCLYVSY